MLTVVREGFRVDDAVPADAGLLANLGARTFFESFAADNDPEDMRRHLESQFAPSIQLAEIGNPALDTLLMRDAQNRAVAFAQLRSVETTAGVCAEGSIELWRFYVDKAWHGLGIAHTLMGAAKARGRRRGASTMWLGVWERNARAQAFYRKHGFEKVGSQVFVVGSDPQIDDVFSCRL